MPKHLKHLFSNSPFPATHNWAHQWHVLVMPYVLILPWHSLVLPQYLELICHILPNIHVSLDRFGVFVSGACLPLKTTTLNPQNKQKPKSYIGGVLTTWYMWNWSCIFCMKQHFLRYFLPSDRVRVNPGLIIYPHMTDGTLLIRCCPPTLCGCSRSRFPSDGRSVPSPFPLTDSSPICGGGSGALLPPECITAFNILWKTRRPVFWELPVTLLSAV